MCSSDLNLISGGKSSVIGLMVKTAQLPSYQIDVDTMNQYNRKRLIQKKINYNPCQIVFNDDHSDLIRNMWYQYYQYYYSDPTYQYGNTPAQPGVLGQLATPLLVIGGNYNVSDVYAPNRPVEHWGLSGQGYTNPTLTTLASSLLTGPASGQQPFFNDITIYGMSQKTYAQYTMINPMITNWTHDTYDYSQGNQVITHSMTFRYETVKYYAGAIGQSRPDTNVVGFADPAYYDTVPSALARPGSTATVLGQGGLLDAAGGIVEDLSSGGPLGVIGAVQKAGTAYNTFKGKDIKSMAINETVALGNQVIKGAVPSAMRQIPGRASGMYYPTPQNPPTN